MKRCAGGPGLIFLSVSVGMRSEAPVCFRGQPRLSCPSRSSHGRRSLIDRTAKNNHAVVGGGILYGFTAARSRATNMSTASCVLGPVPRVAFVNSFSTSIGGVLARLPKRLRRVNCDVRSTPAINAKRTRMPSSRDSPWRHRIGVLAGVATRSTILRSSARRVA